MSQVHDTLQMTIKNLSRCACATRTNALVHTRRAPLQNTAGRNPPITCKTNRNHGQRRRLIASARRGGVLMRSGANSSTHNSVTGITSRLTDNDQSSGADHGDTVCLFFFPLFFPFVFRTPFNPRNVFCLRLVHRKTPGKPEFRGLFCLSLL